MSVGPAVEPTWLPGLSPARFDAARVDPERIAVSRGLQVTVRLQASAVGMTLSITDGDLDVVAETTHADIIVTAPDAVWRNALATAPSPRHQSFTALQSANADVTITGDPLCLAQSRGALERLFEMLRPPATPTVSTRRLDLSRIAGRYATLAAPDGTYEIYMEEAGEGIPVVLLHTAGADSRQYQAQLADTELGHGFRFIAFDCPFHGRSMPPLDWDGGPYQLSQARYLGWVTSFIEQHAEGRAILVGCSMGAAITVVTAAERPELLWGAIGLEPPLRSPGRRNAYLAHAAVAGGVHNSAYVRGLMSPTSPEAMRRRAGWIYAQGGPGIYAGDLAFYSDEFDGTVVGPRIDTDRCPVHLLCGEYDYSATPQDGLALSHLIRGSHYWPMPGLGHFPMTEDPERFRAHFATALAAIMENSKNK